MLMSVNFKKYCLFAFRRSWKSSIKSGFPPGASGMYKDLSVPEHHKIDGMTVSVFREIFDSGKATRVQEMVGRMDP